MRLPMHPVRLSIVVAATAVVAWSVRTSLSPFTVVALFLVAAVVSLAAGVAFFVCHRLEQAGDRDEGMVKLAVILGSDAVLLVVVGLVAMLQTRR